MATSRGGKPHHSKVRGAAYAALVALLCAAAAAFAGPIDPDGTFGEGGAFVSLLGSPSFARVNDVAVQEDGRVVLVGIMQDGVDHDPDQWVVARLTSLGGLDPTFNPAGPTPGILVRRLSPSRSEARALSIAGDGKIVVVGSSGALNAKSVVVERLLDDGSLDATFNPSGPTPGSFTSQLGRTSAEANAVALDSSGRIVLAGTGVSGASASKLLIARLTPSGGLHADFGTGGATSPAFEIGAAQANDVAIDAVGRIVVAGAAQQSSVSRFIVARLLTGGGPDTSFDGDGFALPGFAAPGAGEPNAAAYGLLMRDTAPLLVGTAGAGVALAARTSTGAPDTTFASSRGTTRQAFGSSSRFDDVTQDANGAILAAGTVSANGQSQPFLARYNATGSPDTGFDPASTPANHRVYPFSEGPAGGASSLARMTNGRLLLGGSAFRSGHENALVARLGGDTVAPTAAFGVNWTPAGSSGLPKPLRPGQVATFDGGASTDSDGAVVAWQWNLDGAGGFELSGQKVSKSFAEPGSHDVALRVRDDDGIFGVLTKPVVVKANDQPVASFSPGEDASARAGRTFFLNGGASTDPDGALQETIWDLNGDGAYEQDTKNDLSQTHVFPSGGRHQVGLRVIDDEGAVASVKREYDVAWAGFELEYDEDLTTDGLTLNPGNTVSAKIKIKREPTANYRIKVSPGYSPSSETKGTVNGEKSLVQVDGDEFTIGFEANQHATPFTNNKITFTAEANVPGPDPPKQQITVPANIVSRHDGRLTGLEVTQGVQEETEPCHLEAILPGAPPGHLDTSRKLCKDNRSITFGIDGNGNQVENYSGVSLVARKKTIVRVYGSQLSSTKALFNVSLTARRGSKTLGTITSQSGLRALPTTPAGHRRASFTDRADPANSWWFTLPATWTEFGVAPLELSARLLPPVSTNSTPPPLQGTQPYELKNDSIVLRNLVFLPTGQIDVGLVRMWHTGESLNPDVDPAESPPSGGVPSGSNPQRTWPSPKQVMSYASAAAPLADGKLYYAPYYRDFINIGDVLSEPSGDRLDEVRSILDDAADENYDCGKEYCGDQVLGVIPSSQFGSGVSMGCIADCGLSPSYAGDAVAVARWSRPDSIAHEMFHGWGTNHSFSVESCASADQQDQIGDRIDGSGRGYLTGVAVDPRGALPGTTLKAPYRVLAPKQLGGVQQTPSGPPQEDYYYDVMSYCIDPGAGRQRWPSVQGWEILYQRAMAIKSSLGRAKRVPFGIRASQVPVTAMVVRAIDEGATGARVLSVGTRLSGGRHVAAARYQVRVLSAGGDVLAEVPAEAQRGDEGGTYLTAEAPMLDAAAVVVLRDGVEIARRAASANAPLVRIVAPTAGNRVGAKGKQVRVRWEASDADGDPLDATIAYSTDAGATWRSLARTGTENEVIVPASALSRSSTARVRVTVNDGFSDASVESETFRAEGAPPAAEVESPGPRTRLPAGSTLYLGGRAADDAGHPLAGKSLRWYLGRRQVASGEAASVRVTEPGSHVLRLVARDGHGRTGSARVPIRVDAVPVTVIELTAPSRLSPKAKTVSLRVATSLPTTVRIGAQKFRVDAKARILKVKVRPGKKELRLTLRLGSGKLAATAAVAVARKG